MSKTKRLRELLLSGEVTILMEAHNGLSAKLAEEAGFEALWGSGLSISAALGVRDNNEASWTQVLEVLEFMSDATSIPILLDGDTGYGNFNNVRRLVRKLEQRNIAGVCLEDKLFPKTNSFIDGERQMLAEVDEFCGKLRAAKDTQLDADFVVVARTEAFIAGWGLHEALLRATAYAESGADVILVHSKRKDSQEIMEFMKHWKVDTPVVIVPTKYPSEPISSFVEAGISNFIFANHSLRTVITSLRENLATLRQTQDLMSVEKRIAPVDEIFQLQNVKELKGAEERYLPQTDDAPRALVLAATQGNFGALVADKPKCMLRLQGKPVLSWHKESFNRQGIRTVGVVRGYRKEAVDLGGMHYFDNDRHEETGELFSLYQARDFLQGDVVIAYGDILFDQFILQNLLSQDAEIAIAADAGFRMRRREDKSPDLVSTSGSASPLDAAGGCALTRIGPGLSPEEATGEWVGLLALRGEGTVRVTKELDKMAAEDRAFFERAGLVDLFNRLVDGGDRVPVAPTFGHWRALDEAKDLLDSDQAS